MLADGHGAKAGRGSLLEPEQRLLACQRAHDQSTTLSFDAAQRGTLEHLDGNLRAWASTAGTYGQPDAMRALLSQVDLEGIVEVLPPSEGQVRAAQA